LGAGGLIKPLFGLYGRLALELLAYFDLADGFLEFVEIKE